MCFPEIVYFHCFFFQLKESLRPYCNSIVPGIFFSFFFQITSLFRRSYIFSGIKVAHERRVKESVAPSEPELLRLFLHYVKKAHVQPNRF